MKEADFVRDLRKNFLGVMHKNHGSRFGTAGLPDLEGCFKSHAVVIEAKIGYLDKRGFVRLKSPLTNIQKHWLLQYHNHGADALLAIYLENEKRIIFFAWREPWCLHVDGACIKIDFLRPEFVEKKVWFWKKLFA